jgi:hypothetical protein
MSESKLLKLKENIRKYKKEIIELIDDDIINSDNQNLKVRLEKLKDLLSLGRGEYKYQRILTFVNTIKNEQYVDPSLLDNLFDYRANVNKIKKSKDYKEDILSNYLIAKEETINGKEFLKISLNFFSRIKIKPHLSLQ